MRQLEGLLAMAGLYAFRFGLNGDAREELSFKVRFGAVVHADDHDRTHVQSFEVRRVRSDRFVRCVETGEAFDVLAARRAREAAPV